MDKLSKLINKSTSCKFTVIETAGGVSSPAPSGNLLVILNLNIVT